MNTPPGVFTNTNVKLHGRGHCSEVGGAPGDLILRINIRNEKNSPF